MVARDLTRVKSFRVREVNSVQPSAHHMSRLRDLPLMELSTIHRAQLMQRF